MSKVLGIDLGTTNSAMAYIEGGDPEILTNAEGERITPSVVALSKDDELLVGQPAKRQAVTNPEDTIASIKRKMGSDATVTLGEDDYTPQQISAFILQKLKRDAEERLGEDVDQAVITVPAYFSDAQRQATKDAGKIADLDVLRIINEPTAAALAYGYGDEQERTLVVFDLGGGTFDVSILETGDGVFEVKATSGDNELGGDDFDQVLIDHFTKHLKKTEDLDVTGDRQILQRLKQAAEEAKIELSSKQKTDVNIPFIAQQDGEPVHLDLSITRAELENMCSGLLDRLKGPTQQAMDDAGLSNGQADAVIMVGGMTRMPAVREVAHKITGVEPDLKVNPDEAVAMGAAIQAGVLSGDVGDLLLLDVTPLTLGIETLGGRFTPLIERNTTIPTEKSRIFSTAEDNQTQVDIHVFQGERPVARENKHLGNFILDGIPPAPRGQPQIEVTFEIDADGILRVAAEDKGTGKKQAITIEDANRLDDDEIDQMKEEAERFAEEDEKRAQRIDAANQAEGTIHAAKDALEQAEDLDEAIVTKVEDAIDALETELSAEEIDVEAIEAKTEDLREAMMEIGQAMYQDLEGQAGQGPQAAGMGGMAGMGGAGPAQGAPGQGQAGEGQFKTKKGEDEDSVDVEYEVKDDE